MEFTTVKIFDGAFGTLKQTGMSSKDIYKSYIQAGANCLTVNGFDLDVNNQRESLKNLCNECRAVCDALFETDSSPILYGSIGPTNKMISLSSDRVSAFDTLYSLYRNAVQAYNCYGIKRFLIETSQDILNVKAALKAIADESPSSIVIVSCTTDQKGNMLDGHHFITLLNALKPYKFIEAFGFNCGMGPKSYQPLLEELSKVSYLPIYFAPNAGIPKDGVYNSDQFIEELSFIKEGKLLVNYLGGCCGTTPIDITKLTKFNLTPYSPKIKEKDFIVIAENLNANGSRKFLNAAKLNSVMNIKGIIESLGTPDYLDVNLDNPQVSSPEEVYLSILHNCSVPICIDSSYPHMWVRFLKATPQRALVNSISLAEGYDVYEHAFETVKSFGADVIVSAQNKSLGFGKTLVDKIEIADELLSLHQDVYYDICLHPICLDINSDSDIRTYKDLCSYIRSRYPRTKIIAGVSNISFAFKGNTSFRRILNVAFTKWLNLDGVIANPNHFVDVDSISSDISEVISLLNKCYSNESITEDLLNLSKKYDSIKPIVNSQQDATLIDALVAGDVKFALTKLVNPVEDLTKAITILGEKYDSGELRIIQLLIAADTMKQCLSMHTSGIKEFKYKGILCTVKGDVHDIGKDIVKSVITTRSVEVTDLGIDVSKEKILSTLLSDKYDFVGLSGLISPSLDVMRETCIFLDKHVKYPIKIFLGGAVVYPEWVESLQFVLSNIKVLYSKNPVHLINLL